jgi:hypothetical protein
LLAREYESYVTAAFLKDEKADRERVNAGFGGKAESSRRLAQLVPPASPQLEAMLLIT